MLRSSKSGIRGAVNIGRLFSDIQQHGYQKTFDDLGIEYQGKSAKEICSGLVNYIVESSDSKEDSVARIAAVNAMSKMYEYMENNNMEVILEKRRNEPNLKLINMEQVEVEKIDWLLYPFIPFGKVTIVQGDPGEGKTTMVLQIIAKLTKGEPVLLHGEEMEVADKMIDLEPVNVIYQTAEDGLGDTIKPRLLTAGADCSRVLVIDDNDQALTMMDARLEEAIVQTKSRLVVLDPIQGFLGADVNMHRANEIRPLMKRVTKPKKWKKSSEK